MTKRPWKRLRGAIRRRDDNARSAFGVRAIYKVRLQNIGSPNARLLAADCRVSHAFVDAEFIME